MATHAKGSILAPQLLELNLSPAEVADGLRNLPGLVFFDTSGNLPSRSHSPVSIIAARPLDIIKGDISDMRALRLALDNQQEHQSEYDFPTGGACGWVDYEGDFCFGIYPEMLIYQHDKQQWWQCGGVDLANEIGKADSKKSSVSIGEFRSTMTREIYEDGVRAIHDYISAGDIYQVNLTQKFIADVEGESLFPLYSYLRSSTPAPLSVWMQLGDREILSSSPETFLRMSGRSIETRPIKGTRPKFTDPIKDEASAKELLASEKEIAELIMITDLERNDLGQICDFGSVKVEEMLALEALEQVYHLVSTVTGKLQTDVDHLTALQACFPGGSITGAPKKRAMEIITELEKEPRGLYTGAVGYIGFNGESQFNIPIRTLVREGDQLHYHVGAGIVADSNPSEEYEETLQKAKGIRLAIDQFRKNS